MASTDALETELESDVEVPTDLLCVFVHGFKGTDSTFGTFPERLQHILSGPGSGSMKVECVVFPAYETKGELSAATDRFVDWLTTTVVNKEVSNGNGGGAGKTKIVLCGHSMGGLLVADATLAIAHSRLEKAAPLWPRIIACLAFDTPYYGLHPFIFKNHASKAVSYAQTAHQLATGLGIFGVASAASGSRSGTSTPSGSSKSPELALVPPPPATAQSSSPVASTKGGWSKWAPAALGAVVAGAAAGAAYYRKDDLTSGFGWAGDHMKYVGNLWDEKALRKRVDSLIAVRKESGVMFHNFYTLISGQSSQGGARTFINVPRKTSEAFQYHSPNQNSMVTDEIDAHVGMFGPTTNDGFYELGLQTAEIIHRAVEEAKEVEARDAVTSMKNIELDSETPAKSQDEDLL